MIRVDGFDVVADPYAVRARIGLTGQYAGLDEALSGRANLMLIGRLAGLRRANRPERAAELIGRFDLAAAAGRAVGTYSGGMRRRADLAASLMARPSLLVLDEPTTGLDPAGRHQLWESLAALRDEGTTMLLTTSTWRKPNGSPTWCTSWIRAAGGQRHAGPAACPDRNPAGRGAVRAGRRAAAAAGAGRPAACRRIPVRGPGVRAAHPGRPGRRGHAAGVAQALAADGIAVADLACAAQPGRGVPGPDRAARSPGGIVTSPRGHVTSLAARRLPRPPPAARPGPAFAPGPRRTSREAALIFGRQLAILRANPPAAAYPLIQPVVLLVLFLAIFAGLARVPGATYRQYLVPGIIVQNVALTAPTVGLGIVLDAASGITDRFRSLPIARSAVLLGRMLAESLIFAVQALLVLGVASLLGFRVATGLPGMAGIVVIAVTFGVALGITMSWLALRIHDPDTAGRALFLPMVPLTFISSTFTPIDRLAGWLQPLARANPVTAAVNLIRTLADGGPLGREPLYFAVWIAALSVIPGLLAIRRWQGDR